MTDQTTRTIEAQAARTGAPSELNAVQVAREREGTSDVTWFPTSLYTSAETAFVIPDYPYGFRLRCQKRVWIERNKKGCRLVEQTSNPKKTALVWNKPKAGTYSLLLVLGMERASGFLTTTGIYRAGVEDARLDTFEGQTAHVLSDADKKTLAECRAVNRALSRVKWTATTVVSEVGTINLSAAMSGDPVEKAKLDAEVARQAERKAARKIEEKRQNRLLNALIANEVAVGVTGEPLPFPSLGTSAAPPAQDGGA